MNLHPNNNFLSNSYQAIDEYSGLNKWDIGGFRGGNYWDDYDEPADGCIDNDSNNFCDSPLGIPINPSFTKDSTCRLKQSIKS